LLPLIEERQAIFLRWKRAFRAQNTTLDTHPALPEERARYEELSKTIGPIRVDAKRAVSVRAAFRNINVDGLGTEVEWRLF
jgi:hypothetical protein